MRDESTVSPERRPNICASTSTSRPSRWRKRTTPTTCSTPCGSVSGRILFATDYPHWDFDDPVMAIPPSLNEEQRRMIFAKQHSKELFGLE